MTRDDTNNADIQALEQMLGRAKDAYWALEPERRAMRASAPPQAAARPRSVLRRLRDPAAAAAALLLVVSMAWLASSPSAPTIPAQTLSLSPPSRIAPPHSLRPRGAARMRLFVKRPIAAVRLSLPRRPVGARG